MGGGQGRRLRPRRDRGGRAPPWRQARRACAVATLDEAHAAARGRSARACRWWCCRRSSRVRRPGRGARDLASSLEDYGRLRAAGVGCGVHVKADTGMGRWGLAPADALAAGRALAAGGRRCGRWHWGRISRPRSPDPACRGAAERFADLARRFPPWRPAPRELGRHARAPRDPLRRGALRHRGVRRVAVRGRAGRARTAARAAPHEPGRRLARARSRASPRATAGA